MVRPEKENLAGGQRRLASAAHVENADGNLERCRTMIEALGDELARVVTRRRDHAGTRRVTAVLRLDLILVVSAPRDRHHFVDDDAILPSFDETRHRLRKVCDIGRQENGHEDGKIVKCVDPLMRHEHGRIQDGIEKYLIDLLQAIGPDKLDGVLAHGPKQKLILLQQLSLAALRGLRSKAIEMTPKTIQMPIQSHDLSQS